MSKEFSNLPPQRRRKEWVDPAIGLDLRKDEEVKEAVEPENIKNIIMLYMNAKK